MRAPIFLATRADILWGLFVVAVVACALFLSVTNPGLFWQRGGMRGNFGPDWDCQYSPKSEPVCVKRVPKAPSL